jgi:ketosteroid isomerase-like protein
MDSPTLDSQHLESALPQTGSGESAQPVESANLQAIRVIFDALTEGGVAAGAEHLLRYSQPDCVYRLYMAGERVLYGRQEAREYFSEAAASGASMSVRARTFEEHGDEVVVGGSVRLQRPSGGFAESQISWTFRFRDGLVEAASWGPRASTSSSD